MKIFILFKFKTGPWGGGNQFLRGMRNYLHGAGLLTDSLYDADVVLLNSFPFESEHTLFQLILQKIRKPDLIVIHRIDGPLSLYRGYGKMADILIWRLNMLMSDGTIFQTEWSRTANAHYQKKKQKYVTTIMNAPLPIFFQSAKERTEKISGKIRLIAVSWSSNWNKGFDYYKYLDDNLDFSRYSMTFVGRSPVQFRNIQSLPPVPPDQIAQLLSRHDIYLTASHNDPCSNALLEALASGLPVVARASGGHPEIVKKGGALYSSPQELITAIDKVASEHHLYRNMISVQTMDEAAKKYIDFINRVHLDKRSDRYIPTRIILQSLLVFTAVYCIYILYNRIELMGRRFIISKEQAKSV